MKLFGKTDSWLLAQNDLPDEITCTHPKLKRLVQKAFTIRDGKKKYTFYEFKSIHDMPSRRYETLNSFIEDNNRKVENSELDHYLEECLAQINKNTPENLANVITIIKMLRMRVEFSVNVDLVMRLISCAFFTKDEDLMRYDWDIGNWKIDLFEKHGLSAFFLFEPVKRWLPQTNISDGDIKIILKQQELQMTLLKELNKLGISTLNPYEKKKETQNIT